MKLQILVTHYNEPEEVVATLLDSIEEQLHKVSASLFGVIIVNDGHTHPLSDKFLNQYSYRIDQYSIDKANVSVARNYALSKATARYVMFCDCDDCFFLDFAFQWIIREMPFTVFNSVFVEENGGMHLTHKHDNTFIHGKVFSRKYLIENDLKFDEELYCHEDGYFILLAQACADKIRYFEHPFYMWKERKGSVARRENYIQDSWHQYLLAKRKVIAELNKRGLEEVSQFVINSLLIEARERNLNKHNLLETAKFYREFKDLKEALEPDRRAELEKSMSELYKHKVTTDAEYYDKLLEVL